MNANISHLEWAVKSRYRNQQSAVRLLELFLRFDAQWKTTAGARAAQGLLAVSFSLWRAAFLADKTGRRKDVFANAKEFLEKMIEDNAISYPQDRKCKEWTFNYYTTNARACLEILHKHWPKQVTKYEGKKRTPTKRWDYCQDLLDAAVDNFAQLWRDKAIALETKTKNREAKKLAKERRKRSRDYTLHQRNMKAEKTN